MEEKKKRGINSSECSSLVLICYSILVVFAPCLLLADEALFDDGGAVGAGRHVAARAKEHVTASVRAHDALLVVSSSYSTSTCLRRGDHLRRPTTTSSSTEQLQVVVNVAREQVVVRQVNKGAGPDGPAGYVVVSNVGLLGRALGGGSSRGGRLLAMALDEGASQVGIGAEVQRGLTFLVLGRQVGPVRGQVVCNVGRALFARRSGWHSLFLHVLEIIEERDD